MENLSQMSFHLNPNNLFLLHCLYAFLNLQWIVYWSKVQQLYTLTNGKNRQQLKSSLRVLPAHQLQIWGKTVTTERQRGQDISPKSTRLMWVKNNWQQRKLNMPLGKKVGITNRRAYEDGEDQQKTGESQIRHMLLQTHLQRQPASISFIKLCLCLFFENIMHAYKGLSYSQCNKRM